MRGNLERMVVNKRASKAALQIAKHIKRTEMALLRNLRLLYAVSDADRNAVLDALHNLEVSCNIAMSKQMKFMEAV